MRPNEGQHLGRSATVENGGIESGTGFDERVALGQRLAAGDLAWLLGRHYAPDAALTLVGNRYQLRQRQRHALRRAVAAPAVARARRARQVGLEALMGASLQVDALNQLITIEVALA